MRFAIIIAALALTGCASITRPVVQADLAVSAAIIKVEARANSALLRTNVALAKQADTVERLAQDCLVAAGYVEALAAWVAPGAVAKAEHVKAVCQHYADHPKITVASAAQDLANALTAAQVLAQRVR